MHRQPRTAPVAYEIDALLPAHFVGAANAAGASEAGGVLGWKRDLENAQDFRAILLERRCAVRVPCDDGIGTRLRVCLCVTALVN